MTKTREIMVVDSTMARALLVALAALPCLCHANLPHSMSRVQLMEGAMPTQSQTIAHQAVGLAYVEPMALIGGQLGRGQPSTASRTCARPLAHEHQGPLGRTAPAFPTFHHLSNGRRALRADMSWRKKSSLSMQADSFDPLGLAGGMTEDVDTAIIQKQLWEAAKGGDLEGIETAVKSGADINFQMADEGGATALHCAALNGNNEAVAKLVALGANVNSEDKYKWTPMHDAALNGHTETVKKLVELGGSVSATTDVEEEAPGSGMRTALTNAAMNGHTATVEALVALGADVNHKQKDGWTALHLAAKNGWEGTVEKLVSLGIDVNVKNEVDMTALHYAAWDATVETCEKLIELGVDVAHKAKGKLSALDLAEKRRKEKAGRMIASVLRKAQGIAEVETLEEDYDGPWKSPADAEWRKLISNDPYKKSAEGGNI